MYEYLGNKSKRRPTNKAGSYRLVLSNGQISFNEYEPIPTSVYLEGAKYISGFLAGSALTFIMECIVGKWTSLQHIRWLVWSVIVYARQYFSIAVSNIKLFKNIVLERCRKLLNSKHSNLLIKIR